MATATAPKKTVARRKPTEVAPKSRRTATKTAPPKSAPKTSTATKSLADAKSIREWANANGFDVGSRGRFSEEVKAAYAKAHKPRRKK